MRGNVPLQFLPYPLLPLLSVNPKFHPGKSVCNPPKRLQKQHLVFLTGNPAHRHNHILFFSALFLLLCCQEIFLIHRVKNHTGFFLERRTEKLLCLPGLEDAATGLFFHPLHRSHVRRIINLRIISHRNQKGYFHSQHGIGASEICFHTERNHKIRTLLSDHPS